MKSYSSDNFVMELNKINWFQVTDIEDANRAWALFQFFFIQVLNRVPNKQVRLKQRSEPGIVGYIHIFIYIYIYIYILVGLIGIFKSIESCS